MAQLKEKICSLSEAAALVPHGARLALGGFAIHNHPMGFVYELIRRGVKDLTIIGHVNGPELDILVGAGCVKKGRDLVRGPGRVWSGPCLSPGSGAGEARARGIQ